MAITYHSTSRSQESISRRFRLAFGRSGPRSLSILHDINGDLVCSNRRPSCRNASFQRGGWASSYAETSQTQTSSRSTAVGINMRKFQDVEILLGSAKLDVPFLFPNPSAQVPPLFFGWGRFERNEAKEREEEF